jgi:hypothetical protein
VGIQLGVCGLALRGDVVAHKYLRCKICATARLAKGCHSSFTRAEVTVRHGEQEPASAEGIAGLLQILRHPLSVRWHDYCKLPGD